jgi:hypothetical protein
VLERLGLWCPPHIREPSPSRAASCPRSPPSRRLRCAPPEASAAAPGARTELARLIFNSGRSRRLPPEVSPPSSSSSPPLSVSCPSSAPRCPERRRPWPLGPPPPPLCACARSGLRKKIR